MAYTGPYCSHCGVRNAEERSFCRSCGESLLGAATPVEPASSWWRRLLGRLRIGRREYSAGERPASFRRPSNPEVRPEPQQDKPEAVGVWGTLTKPRRFAFSRFAPLLIVLSVAGLGLGVMRERVTHAVFSTYATIRQQVAPQYISLTPVEAKASSAAAKHGAPMAIDGVRDTYWLSAAPTGGVGQSLTIRFAKPVDIDRVGILSGAPKGDFRAEPRLRSVRITAVGVKESTLGFDDKADFQNRPVTLHGVSEVTIFVEDVYPGQKGQALALREIQFFQQK